MAALILARQCDQMQFAESGIVAAAYGAGRTKQIGKPRLNGFALCGINKCRRAAAGQRAAYARRNTMCVISGGAPSLTGAPTVPIPRFTYKAASPFGAFGISLMVSPMRFGSLGIDSGR